jgi:hypothetical protein
MTYAVIGLTLVYTALVVASWVLGRQAGVNAERLKDALEHEAARIAAKGELARINAALEEDRKDIEERKLEPLTQEAVDRLLKKHDSKPS